MTATAETPARRGFIPKTLDDVTRAITVNAIPEVVERFHADTEAAFQRATAERSFDAYRDLVENWWAEAAAWDYDQRGTAATYEVAGQIRRGEFQPTGMTREDIRERYGL